MLIPEFTDGTREQAVEHPLHRRANHLARILLDLALIDLGPVFQTMSHRTNKEQYRKKASHTLVWDA